MAVTLSPIGGAAGQFFDNNGDPLSGGKIYTYASGTTTNQTTYTTAAGSTAHTNPIILDSAGRVPSGEIWLTNGVLYKFVLKTSADVLIGTYDNISGFFQIDSSLVTYTPAGTGAVTTTVQAKLRQTVSVMDFGAKGDGVADDTAAIQAAINNLNTVSATLPATLVFPAGSYLVTNELDFTATGGQRREVIGGTGFETAKILVNFSGYSKYVFKLGNPAVPAYQRGISITGFQFSKVTSAHQSPVGIGGNGLAQSRISNVVFGEWDNTGIQLYAPQNCRFSTITMFGCGHSWDYKSTAGITVRQTTTTLTSSAALFSASDVGHTVALWGPTPNYARRKTVITGYTSSTQVTVSTSYTDVIDYSIYFGSPFATMTAGSSALTTDSQCFSPNDVGLVIYVKGAGANGRLLRSKIAAYSSASSITLADVAITSVTTAEFATPALDVHSVGAATGAGGSDNSFYALQIEAHNGIAAGLINQDQLSFDATKLHGQQTIAANKYALTAIWSDQISGYYEGSFDAQCLGEEKVFAAYQSSVFNFQTLLDRTCYDEIFLNVGLRASGFEGGLIQLDNVGFLGAAPTLTSYSSLIKDANTPVPGYVFSGKLSNFAANLTRVYLGNSLYGVPEGTVSAQETAGQYNLYRVNDGGTVGTAKTLTSTVTWDGTPPSGATSLRYYWQRTGNLVNYWFRLKYATAGVTNSNFVIALPSDMPLPTYPTNLNASDLIGAIYGGISANTTAISSANIGFLRRNSAGTGFDVGITNNSGTVSAIVGYAQGFYFTA